ncbi:putative calcium/calmodulin-dependent protein kinase [Lupinus albus]|uniref:Putative calcium/calmodulin-dependent protein kinase n=1 Tax=Lupinus albus TaxID=3870 RepID=A0A6A4QUF1_LUPAL|nr:putative calcium/calmodulin-dependent protein kinase [Lupinus albus]
MRTLSKTPSYQTSSTCPKKSTKTVMWAYVNAQERTTCSSTLKDYKFPVYLMLNSEGTESEGASVMKVCSYKYCSLNDHLRQPSLPPLKCSMSARRNLLKTQKSMKHETRSPQILKGPCETKKDKNIEQGYVFDGRPAYDEANMVSPIVTPLAQEIDMQFFIEVRVKENEGDIEDQQQMNFSIEENGLAVEEDGVKQVTPSMTHDVVKSETDLEQDLKICFDDITIESDTNQSFYQEQNAEDADESQQPTWFHEEVSIGSCRSNVSYNEENEENIELDEHYCASRHEEDIDSSVSSEETDSKSESFLKSFLDVSAMKFHDIASSHIMDILVEEAVQEANEEENTCSETESQGITSFLEGTSESIETRGTDYSSIGISCDQSSSTEEVFQHLTGAEDNNRENEKHVGDEASCATKILDHEMVENNEGHKMIEACAVDENLEDSNSSQENNDESISKEKQTITVVQGLQLLEVDQVNANKLESSSFIGDEKENASNSWQWTTTRQRRVQDDDEEMRKIKPQKPNFVPLAPDQEPKKVKLKHQMMDERKNADEWMLDFALRQTITKLAPAGNTKVALLIEAFETVMSIPKRETDMRNNSTFAHARPIQACI